MCKSVIVHNCAFEALHQFHCAKITGTVRVNPRLCLKPVFLSQNKRLTETRPNDDSLQLRVLVVRKGKLGEFKRLSGPFVWTGRSMCDILHEGGLLLQANKDNYGSTAIFGALSVPLLAESPPARRSFSIVGQRSVITGYGMPISILLKSVLSASICVRSSRLLRFMGAYTL